MRLFPFRLLWRFLDARLRLGLSGAERGRGTSSLLLLLDASTSCLAGIQGSEVSALGLVKRGDPMAPLGGAPRLVLLFSGKRKSGKDFVTEALQSRCPRVQGSRRKGATASGGHDGGARRGQEGQGRMTQGRRR